MSAKTSPSNSRDANVSAGAAGVVPPNVASGVVQIKKELPSDEIKEFAQHTMNELLGWYGFDGVDVDRLDLTAKTSRLLQSAAAAAAHQQQQQQQQQQHMRNSHLRSSRSYHNNNNSSSNNNNNNSSSNNNYNSSSSNSNGNGNGNNNNRKPSNLNCHSNTTTPSDHDTRSSREDDSKSPHSIGKPAGTALMTSHSEEKIDFSNCCWCHRPIAENAPDYLTSTDGPRYCSESCFTQSRRASFKKAKTCDWCKHVRHAVSYVDFQDGASQLQFCSEKCLNQYKMQIFCNETQAHLDMNPHLREQGLEAAAAGDGAGLITPDLWLRNCRSRSASPASTISVSPGPTTVASKRSSPCLTPPQHPSKPLISVAPVSKLLAQKCSSSVVPAAPPPPPQRHHMHPAPKSGRRKRPHRAAASGGGSGSETVAAILQKQQQLQQQQQQQQQQPATLSADFAGSSVPLPPLSPMQEPHAQQQQPHSTAQPAQQLPQPQLPQLGRPPTSIPASYFATPPNGLMGHPFGARPGPPPPPHPFLPPPPGMLPRGFAAHFAPHPHQAAPPPPIPNLQQPQLPELQGALGALLGAAPPVTVMVPYPIIIPLPIPIPVPLPIVDFYKAHLTPEQRKRYDEERSAAAAGRQEEQPQPLDCSKAKSELELELEQDEDMKHVEQQAMSEQNEQDEQQQQPDSVEEQQQQPDSVEELEQELKSIPKTTPSPSTCNSPATDSTGTGREEATHCIVVHNVEPADSNDNATACSEKLPKIKITRLQTKRTLIQTKDAAAAAATAAPTSPAGNSNSSSATTAAECSRPLRKRKRIIDCDFQKIALRDLEAIDTQKQSNSNSSNGNKEEEDEEDVCNMNGNNNSAKATKK